VKGVCADFETSSLDEKDKALFRYLAVVNDEPATVTQADVDAARAAGWSDRALFDAATVCAIFNFFNRWIDAAGIPDVPPGFYARRLAENGDVGYAM
jgi:alkylhydroperoxidase family enzyme